MVHAALSVFCRQDAQDAANALLEAITGAEDPSLLDGARDALCAELPREWLAWATDGLVGHDCGLLPIWARLAGYRRLPLGTQLLAALGRTHHDEPVRAHALWALGELRETAAEAALLDALHHDVPGLARLSAIALLKSGRPLGRGELAVLVGRSGSLAAIPLAISGMVHREELAALANAAHDTIERGEVLLALGLLGDGRAIPSLLDQLSHAATAASSAAALYLLSGAPILETVVISEPEDAGLDEDLVDPEPAPGDDDQPEAPIRASTETRLCQDPARWQCWLAEHAELTTANIPLRMGQVMGVESTLAALGTTVLPLRARAWLSDDLRTRAHHDLVYQPDMRIDQQRAAFCTLAGMHDGTRSA